mmetsp:Transcript_13592/g.28500  ORF Transcript_13592/g.28500 Transcript_13592/m.28500 type:complete len:273 (+) Transcript_13592:2-820(+)
MAGGVRFFPAVPDAGKVPAADHVDVVAVGGLDKALFSSAGRRVVVCVSVSIAIDIDIAIAIAIDTNVGGIVRNPLAGNPPFDARQFRPVTGTGTGAKHTPDGRGPGVGTSRFRAVAIQGFHQSVCSVPDDGAVAGPVTAAIDGGGIEIGVLARLVAPALDSIGAFDGGVAAGSRPVAPDDLAAPKVHRGTTVDLDPIVRGEALVAGDGVRDRIEEDVPDETVLVLDLVLQVGARGKEPFVAAESHHANAVVAVAALRVVEMEIMVFGLECRL